MLELKNTASGKGGVAWLKADLAGARMIQEDGTLGDLENSFVGIFASVKA